MPQPLPPGVCERGMCWDLTYDFTKAQVIVIKPEDVPIWNKGARLPVNLFPMAGPFQQNLLANAKTLCGNACVCWRLHKQAVNLAYDPMRMGPNPAGNQTDVYLAGVTARGWFGICFAKGWVKIWKDGKWRKVEDLGEPDLIKEGSSSGGSGGKKKKGKKGKKAQRGAKPRRR
jgi:hypothetical protein